MNTNGTSGSGPGFIIHRDAPRTNGAGTGGIGLSPGEELVAALIANPMLLPVVTDVGVSETHFEQGTGLRGAFRWAPEGAARIKQMLAKGYKGVIFEMLARLVDLRIFISDERAKELAREIIEAGSSNGADRRSDDAAKAKGQTEGLHRNQDRHAAPHTWNDPDWSILEDRRGELPDFPVDTLSPPWQAWIERAAHGAGVTVAHIAVLLLGVISSLIGTARRVRASRSWSEPMTLWTCVVAPSGDRKTPALRVTQRALDLIEKNNSTAINVARVAQRAM
jgi:uncharacterized protein DUF3987